MSINLPEKFKQILDDFKESEFTIYPTDGGEVALFKDGLTAFVWIDGRYPSINKGYSINQICVEFIEVIFGAVVLETDHTDLTFLKTHETHEIKPLTKYSISGKAICKVIISPKWDSNQNSFIN